MNKQKFIQVMMENGETSADIASILGVTSYSLMSKINHTRGSQFNALEITKLKDHWKLSGREMAEIFFDKNFF